MNASIPMKRKEVLIHKLSASQLLKAIKRASQIRYELVDELIAAGRGHEKHSETLLKTDDLSLRSNAASYALYRMTEEKQKRMTYSGTLKPIHELL